MPRFKDEESLAGSSQSPRSLISSGSHHSHTSSSSLELEAQEVESAMVEKGRSNYEDESEFYKDKRDSDYRRDGRMRDGGYSLGQIIMAVFGTSLGCLLIYLAYQRIQSPPTSAAVPSQPVEPVSQVPLRSGKQRHAVIMSSFLQQNISWAQGLTKDWELVPYIMDDPDAKYVVPRNQGREAMTYTTYIIDNYDNLPDHMVFVHGHVSSWHQIEPMDWKINALNFTALDEDMYISLRCSVAPGCGIKEVDLTIPPPQRTEPWDIYMPSFYRKTFERTVAPRHIAAPCCAQFAVSRAAVHLHSKEWWIKFRRPMLRDLEDFEWGYGMDNWHIGLLYEKVWHIAFGKPPVYCPNEDYCRSIQWSNGVSCDVDREPLFTESYGWERIKCHKNYDLHPGVPVFGDPEDYE